MFFFKCFLLYFGFKGQNLWLQWGQGGSLEEGLMWRQRYLFLLEQQLLWMKKLYLGILWRLYLWRNLQVRFFLQRLWSQCLQIRELKLLVLLLLGWDCCWLFEGGLLLGGGRECWQVFWRKGVKVKVQGVGVWVRSCWVGGGRNVMVMVGGDFCDQLLLWW